MVGCGNMGGAMLRRWLDQGLDPAQVTVISPSGRAVPGGVAVINAYDPAAVGTVSTLLLAMKPQQLSAVHAAGLASVRAELLVSILAGVDSATLSSLWPGATVIRAMPNLPVAIGKGVVALHSPAEIDDRARRVAAWMQPLGLVEWIESEGLFDLVTALAGSGPSFTYRFIEALAAAGTALGLPSDQSARLATATVEGAGLLAAEAAETPAVLADQVASPGGSTRAGLNVLDNDAALVSLLTRTLQASENRNREMAAAARA
ncbi:pyrroline-5-carboxylate reductase family protein [Sphingomonas gellani]|nr:pyrroline-5-carboxylate reductase dimerization domain-containing protein [Sphingomonas gellani]